MAIPSCNNCIVGAPIAQCICVLLLLYSKSLAWDLTNLLLFCRYNNGRWYLLVDGPTAVVRVQQD